MGVKKGIPFLIQPSDYIYLIYYRQFIQIINLFLYFSEFLYLEMVSKKGIHYLISHKIPCLGSGGSV